MKPPDGIDDAHPRIRRTSVPWYRLLHSLRFRLIAASILVSGIMALLLVANSVGTMRTALREQAAAWVQSTAPLLNATLAAPLAKRDHATLEAILREIQSSRAFTYAVLRDQSGAVVAGAGWNPQRPLPDLDTGFEAIDGDGRFDTAIAITKDGEHLGALQIGLDASFLATAERHLVSEGTVIVVASFVLATVLLGVIGWFLTRHLRRLTRAGEAMARGDLSVRVDVRARDEVGQLATAFNAMARAVEDRVSQIRASEAKFHAIADYSYDCELWLAPDGRLLWINQRVLALTGFSVDECMAMPDFPVGIVAAHDAGRIRNELQQAATGTSGSDVAFRIRRRDGTAFWAAADWRPIYDHAGEHIGIRLSIRDVSQRKEAENRLSDTLQELEKAYAIQKEYLALASEERARLNALLATMHFGILFVDRDNKIIYSNPAFEQIWLLTSSQMRFAGLNATSVLHHAAHMLADPDSVMDRLMRLPSAVEPSEALELEMADGRLVTQTCHPVRDARQQLVGHLWVYEDVTRERQTASQLLYLAER
ncbi:MAG: PAS domain S-box protein, partial [Burkholderiales bacterium]|nr:PAS domain S-box protein [Burkholderiales bacterium]